MPDMPRPRRLHIHKETTRHGRIVWYFRQGKEKRIRLPGAYGSREFFEAYDRAAAGKEPETIQAAPRETFRWLVDRYYESGRFSKLKPNTQRNHRLMLAQLCKTGGSRSYSLVSGADIKSGIVRREGTPHMAASFVSVMRALFDFAKASGYVDANPVGDINFTPGKTDGYHVWTLDEVAAYEARHAVGTQARLAMDIFLYTGLRRSDAVRLGRQHIREGVISIKAGKNCADIIIPLLPPLAASIAATEVGDLVFLKNRHGRPWATNSFGYWFADCCVEAGIMEGRAHGLRKAGATIAANNGATPFELTAMYGWSSTKMAEVYTRKADKVRLAGRAANKLFPHLNLGAGEDGRKAHGIKRVAKSD